MGVHTDLHHAPLFLLALNSVVMSLEDGLIEKGKREFPYLSCETEIRCKRAAVVTITLKGIVYNKYTLLPSGVT